MQIAPKEPTLTRDLATLADLYFTLAWYVGRRALRTRPRIVSRRRTRRTSRAKRR